MLIFVKPQEGRQVYLSSLGGAIPKYGLYVEESAEVRQYLKDGLLLPQKQAPKKTDKKVKKDK